MELETLTSLDGRGQNTQAHAQEGENWWRACKQTLGVHVDYQYRKSVYEQRLEQAAVDNAAEHVRVTEEWEKQVADTKEANKQTRIHAKDEHEARSKAAVDRDVEIEATKEANKALWKRQLAAFAADCERVANDNKTRVFAGAAVFASQVAYTTAPLLVRFNLSRVRVHPDSRQTDKNTPSRRPPC